MAITINGSGTVTGISAGGLPDGVITTDDIAANAVTQAKRSEQLTLGTSQASTSGTFIDFTAIPSWVKRVTVMFNGVSTNGTSAIIVQLGDSGGFETTGYVSAAEFIEDNAVGTAFTAGFGITNASVAASTYHGRGEVSTLGSNAWTYQSVVNNASTALLLGAGTKTLSDTLTQLRITTVNGTDTFDAGSINILYE